MKTELEEMDKMFLTKKEEMSILECVLDSKETEIYKLHGIVSTYQYMYMLIVLAHVCMYMYMDAYVEQAPGAGEGAYRTITFAQKQQSQCDFNGWN